MRDIYHYYWRLLKQLVSDSLLYWRVELMMGCLTGVAAALISRHVGWIPRSGVCWTIGVALMPYAAIMAVVSIFNAIRAPLKLEKERDSAHDKEMATVRETIQGLEAENQRLFNEAQIKPEFNLEVDATTAVAFFVNIMASRYTARISAIHLNVSNTGQTPFEITKYRLQSADGPPMEFSADAIVLPMHPQRIQVSTSLTEALFGQVPDFMRTNGRYQLTASICKQSKGNLTWSDTKTFDVDIEVVGNHALGVKLSRHWD
jgi:hypothetical protein